MVAMLQGLPCMRRSRVRYRLLYLEHRPSYSSIANPFETDALHHIWQLCKITPNPRTLIHPLIVRYAACRTLTTASPTFIPLKGSLIFVAAKAKLTNLGCEHSKLRSRQGGPTVTYSKKRIPSASFNAVIENFRSRSISALFPVWHTNTQHIRRNDFFTFDYHIMRRRECRSFFPMVCNRTDRSSYPAFALQPF